MLTYYNSLVSRISSREPDPINRARVKMLIYCLTSNLIFVSICVCMYLIQGPALQFARALIAFGIAVFLLFAVTRWNIWRKISHVVSCVITLVVWSNLLFFVQGINIPTLQFVFLIVVYSFYVHGLRWGIFYSFINIVPIIAYTVMDGRTFFSIAVPPQAISQPAFVFVITYNFLIIIFLHFHFFKAFNRNTIQITKTKDNLKSMNTVLENAMEELERSSKARMDFLSTMSHELRTPLNGVIGLSNILMMENPREDQKENLTMLKFSAENLLSLINDILDLNKLESDKIELEKIPFHLHDLLKNSAGSLKINAIKKGLSFEIIVADELLDKLIISDPTRLTQVLTNLVNNAIKFTQSGYVKLETRLTQITPEALTVRFSVKDTGIGIDKDKQKDIFEPFTQASKSTTRQFGGTGLGLSIVKKILQMFQSEIHIESCPGKGSEFWFDIDFQYSVASLKKPEEKTYKKDTLQGLRVLVAEDNLVNVMVIKKLLSQWSIQPVVVNNGAMALKQLEQTEFDIILMDLHMPEMDGYQATKEIRSFNDKSKASVPIIALTASVSNAIDTKVMEAGMDGYLPKPFNPDHLYEKLLHYSNMQ
ncbi:MAG: ATP-binding protein [Sphingobacteriaceae bacterium]